MTDEKQNIGKDKDGLRPCPHCRGEISVLANTCMYCGKPVPKILKNKKELVIKGEEASEKQYTSSTHYAQALGSFDIDDANVEKKNSMVRGNIVVGKPSKKKPVTKATKKPGLDVPSLSYFIPAFKWICILALVILVVIPVVLFTAKSFNLSGTPIFNGKDLTGWQQIILPKYPGNWVVSDGMMYLPKGKGFVRTEKEWLDFKLTFQYKVTPEGDGGIYLRGRSEVQIAGSKYDYRDKTRMTGAVYEQYAPLTDASKSPGEWNEMQIILTNNEMTAYVNGSMIHDKVKIDVNGNYGIPGSIAEPGPIMLQGFGGVWYRNIQIKSLGSGVKRSPFIELSKGSKLNEWKCTGGAERMKNWSFTEGVIHYADNIDGGSQIFTVGEWRDFDLELEYKVGSNTNGGIYLKGLVQIQVRPPTGKRYKGEDGAIYETKAPDCTASKLVGAWNQLRIIWRRRTVSVYLNDITIHNQVELHKPTKAYLSKSLTGEGPIMLERSSGAVWYRNIRLRPAP